MDAQPESDDPRSASSGDVRQSLNRLAIDRSAHLTRIASLVPIGIGALSIVAWVWLEVHAQWQLDDGATRFSSVSVVGGSGGTSFASRMDLLLGGIYSLALPALAIGFGFFLRLGADVLQDRAGGSIGGPVGATGLIDVELDDL